MYQFASGQTDNKTWTKGEECQPEKLVSHGYQLQECQILAQNWSYWHQIYFSILLVFVLEPS